MDLSIIYKGIIYFCKLIYRIIIDFYMGQSNVLVIIDIQEGYRNSWKWDVNFMPNLEELIKSAKENGYHIFYILLPEDTFSNGNRIEEIYTLVKDYNKTCEIIVDREEKNPQDKSKYIADKIKVLSIDLSNIYICGVDLEQCVYKTIEGLITKGYQEKLILHSKATSCSHSFSKDTKLKEIGSRIKIE